MASLAPVVTPSASVAPPILGDGVALAAGTYRLDPAMVGPRFPSIDLTVPLGWRGGAWLLNRPRADQGIPPVAIQFWDVDQVYGHPCQWDGTLRDPGPTAADLAQALAAVPMREASTPIDTELGGATGKFLEWSVPADLAAAADSSFPACDATEEGNHDFKSWTGRGMAGNRYQQGAGQVDDLWILDVDGARLVVDAFAMPYATEAERAELRSVVESIRLAR